MEQDRPCPLSRRTERKKEKNTKYFVLITTCEQANAGQQNGRITF